MYISLFLGVSPAVCPIAAFLLVAAVSIPAAFKAGSAYHPTKLKSPSKCILVYAQNLLPHQLLDFIPFVETLARSPSHLHPLAEALHPSQPALFIPPCPSAAFIPIPARLPRDLLSCQMVLMNQSCKFVLEHTLVRLLHR